MHEIDWQDTIVGLATCQGSGARAILRLSGPDCHMLTAACLTAPPAPAPWPRPRSWPDGFRINAWQRAIPVEVYSWPAGRSFTGQAAIELHLPCSMPLATAIQSELVRCGARLARPGEFTLRAFLSARIDLLQAEAVLGLVHAGDRPALRVALEQFAGGLSRPILHGREALLDLLADLEAGLDFVHEDIRFVTNEELHGRLTEIAAALQVLAGQLGERAIESRSLRVVLLGPVNAGKSSLFNALVGGRAALVSDVAPTTRDYVSATVFIGRYEIELIDTAGLDTAADDLSQRAAQQREAAMQCADLLVLCVPAAWRRLDIETPPLRTVRVRTRHDEAPGTWDPDADCHVTIQSIASINTLRAVLESRLRQLDRVEPGRFAITTRTRAGLDAAIGAVREAIEIHREVGEPEFVAPCVREAVDALGELVGAVYTNDLLDRVFSRFCIGK